MDLRRLEELARDLINDSLAPSTRRVYASGQKRYLEFCRNGGLSPFPLSEDQLCTFVAYLMDEGLQHNSIKGYLSAIRRLQIVRGLGDPFAASWPLLEYTLRGIKLRQAKDKKSRAKKRLPITPGILRETERGVGQGSSSGEQHYAVGGVLYVLLWLPQVWGGNVDIGPGI